MSLEQALAENTSALNNLAAIMQANASTPQTVPSPKLETSSPQEAVAAKKPAPKKTTAKAAPEPTPEPAAEDLSDTAQTPAIEYQQIADAVLAFNQKNGRDKTLELLSTFGVAKAPELKPEQYEEFLAAASPADGADDLT